MNDENISRGMRGVTFAIEKHPDELTHASMRENLSVEESWRRIKLYIQLELVFLQLWVRRSIWVALDLSSHSSRITLYPAVSDLGHCHDVIQRTILRCPVSVMSSQNSGATCAVCQPTHTKTGLWNEWACHQSRKRARCRTSTTSQDIAELPRELQQHLHHWVVQDGSGMNFTATLCEAATVARLMKSRHFEGFMCEGVPWRGSRHLVANFRQDRWMRVELAGRQ